MSGSRENSILMHSGLICENRKEGKKQYSNSIDIRGQSKLEIITLSVLWTLRGWAGVCVCGGGGGGGGGGGLDHGR